MTALKAFLIAAAVAAAYFAGEYVGSMRGIEQGFTAGREAEQHRHELVMKGLKAAGMCRWVVLYSEQLGCERS